MLPIHIREEVVALLAGGEKTFVGLAGFEHFPETREAEQMVVRAARGVVDGRAGFHKERPVARLRKEEFACELLEGSIGERKRVFACWRAASVMRRAAAWRCG